MSDERESKLPRWVQQELHQLRNENEELRRQMALARNEAPERGSTGKVMVHVSGRREEFPIHDRAAVTFRLPNGAPITCQLRDDVLDVNAGWGPLSIEPRASNNAYMRATAR